MWSTFHLQNVVHFSPSKCGPLFTFKMWSTFHLQNVVHFSPSKCGPLFTFKMWSTFHLQNVVHFSPSKCGPLFHLQNWRRYYELIRRSLFFHALYVIYQLLEIKDSVQVISQLPCLLGRPVPEVQAQLKIKPRIVLHKILIFWYSSLDTHLLILISLSSSLILISFSSSLDPHLLLLISWSSSLFPHLLILISWSSSLDP